MKWSPPTPQIGVVMRHDEDVIANEETGEDHEYRYAASSRTRTKAVNPDHVHSGGVFICVSESPSDSFWHIPAVHEISTNVRLMVLQTKFEARCAPDFHAYI